MMNIDFFFTPQAVSSIITILAIGNAIALAEVINGAKESQDEK